MYKSPSNNKNTYNSSSSLDDVMKSSGYENVLEPVTSSLGGHSEIADEEKIYRLNMNILPVFFLDLLAVASLAALAYLLRFTQTFPVLTRGFFCGDETISYPRDVEFRDVGFDVGTILFYCLCLALPIAMILLGEGLFWLCSGARPRKVVRGGCVGCRLHLPLRRVIRFIGVFLLGLLVTSIVADSLKLATGRLRPTFLDICETNATQACQKGTFLNLGNYTCLNADKGDLRWARMSFPSFHASISGFVAVFTMAYCQWLMSGPSSSRLLLLPCFQGALAVLGLLCSAMRVALYNSHWEDAVAGTFLGSTLAVYLTYNVLNGFRERLPPDGCPDVLEQNLRRLEGGAGAPTSAAQVPNSLFFRYFRIPHVSYRNRLSRPYPHASGSENLHGPGSKQPSLHEEFQRDLHQRIEDYVTKRPSMRETGSKF